MRGGVGLNERSTVVESFCAFSKGEMPGGVTRGGGSGQFRKRVNERELERLKT